MWMLAVETVGCIVIAFLPLRSLIFFFQFRFLSSYDSRFNIKQSLDRLQQHSSVSLDDTRVQYILDAVDSARRAFPRHFNKKKKIVEQERESSKNGVALAVNGQDWTDDCDAEKNGFVDEKVNIII